MSNRTLIEVNHDFTGEIARHPDEFVKVLTTYLRSAYRETADDLGVFGVRVFGMRHHSDPFTIEWGGNKASET